MPKRKKNYSKKERDLLNLKKIKVEDVRRVVSGFREKTFEPEAGEFFMNFLIDFRRKVRKEAISEFNNELADHEIFICNLCESPSSTDWRLTCYFCDKIICDLCEKIKEMTLEEYCKSCNSKRHYTVHCCCDCMNEKREYVCRDCKPGKKDDD